MRDLFPGHYPLDESELTALWTDASIVFDTNILLNLHRYSRRTRDDFLEVMRDADIIVRLWLPYQVAMEYHRNLHAVRQRRLLAFDTVQKEARGVASTMRSNLRRDHADHPWINMNDIQRKVDRLVEEIDELLSLAKEQYLRSGDDDLPRTIAEIFSGKVGDAWPKDKLESAYKTGDERYRRKIPPGFRETKEDESKYGDLILWYQIIERTKITKKPVILVTDDAKEDWWLVVNGKKIGPHPELINEFSRETGTRCHIYSGEQFLKFARNRLRLDLRTETVEEIEKLRNNAERLLRQPYCVRWHGFVSAIDRDACELELTQELGEGLFGTFTVPLSPSGTGEPTHFGCSAQWRESEAEKFRRILESRGHKVFRGLAYGIDDSHGLQELRDGAPLPVNGVETRFSFERALREIGLKRIDVHPPFLEEDL